MARSWMNDSDRERFWAKVNKDGPIPDTSDPLINAPATPCWIWTAATHHGYGVFSPPRGARKGNTAVAHRLSFMEAHGRIAEDLQVDHLCRNHACVNPEHLEAVTARINQLRGDGMAGRRARKQQCPQGHVYDERNTHTSPRRQRSCRECRRLRENARRTDPAVRTQRAAEAREYRARKRAERHLIGQP